MSSPCWTRQLCREGPSDDPPGGLITDPGGEQFLGVMLQITALGQLAGTGELKAGVPASQPPPVLTPTLHLSFRLPPHTLQAGARCRLSLLNQPCPLGCRARGGRQSLMGPAQSLACQTTCLPISSALATGCRQAGSRALKGHESSAPARQALALWSAEPQG